jgi:hypothetical protein
MVTKPTLTSIENPFFRQVVGDAWESALADVPGIHSAPFRQFLHVIEEVRRQRRSAGILLKGSAGAGKTHLLARLRSTLEAERRSVIFVSLYMATAPNRIWRHIRRHFAQSLLRPWIDGKPQLDLLLAAKPNLSNLNFSLASVLVRYADGERDLAAAWLRGDDLPPKALERLGVSEQTHDEDETREDVARNIVLGLAKLADPHPVVLCCDQAEALQSVPGDPRGFWTFGQAVSDLHNELDNLVLISCIQSVFASLFEEAVHSSAWQRLAQFQAVLNPLTWDEGVSLLQARLRLSGIDNPAGAIWPLPENQLKTSFEDGRCLARKLIQRSGELFEIVREQPVPEIPPVGDQLADRFAERLQVAKRDIPSMDPDQVLDDGLPALLHLVGFSVDRPDRATEYNLRASSTSGEVILQFCNQQAHAVTRRLERAALMPEDDVRRLVLIRDGRRPVGAQGMKARRLIRKLQEAGARIVQPTVEALAALEAIRSLLADATSGNLSRGGEAIQPETVRDWVSGRLPIELRSFLEDLEPRAPLPGPGETLEIVSKLLTGRYIMRVDELAKAASITPERIELCARQNPSQLGYLAGPPAIVFAVVAREVAEI